MLDDGGPAYLDGALYIERLNGFEPALGDQFVILTASSVTGRFACVRGTNLGNGLWLAVEYGENQVRLVVTNSPPRSPDVNGDGDVDLTDLSIFLSDYGCVQPSEGPRCRGDISGNGEVGLEDLSILLSAFGTTCP